MKILVTGANGYLGQGIVRTLLDRGCDVIATDFQSQYIDHRATIKIADIFEIEDAYEYFERPDIVLHLAWRDGFQHNSHAHINDLPKHYNFLVKFLKAGIHRICVLGSMHEIGFFEGSIDENTPTNPQSLYGISKNALRQLMIFETSKYGIALQWIRGFYIVGNTEHGCSVFSKLVRAAKEGYKTFPFTMGENQFDFLEYKEFCNQVSSVCLQDEVVGIINCCSGRPMKLGECMERFIQENHLKISLDYGAFPDKPYESKALWGNDTKIRLILHKQG